MIFKIKATVKVKKKKSGVFKPFNPNFDGNLLAWYDGDTLATDPANTWSDRSANNFDLTLFNAPTIINNAINGHDALRFDGINQYGKSAAFVRNQPQTIYCVQKFIVEGLGRRVCDGLVGDTMLLWNNGPAQISVFAGVNLIQANNNLVYNIYTCIYNGANSESRINNAASLVGNAGALNANGLTIGANGTPANYFNGEIAYLILRQGADNTATQNLFINYLKNRFAL